MILETALLRSQHCGLNLAFEDWFLRNVSARERMYLFFFENHDALVLGKSLELEKEVFTHKPHPPVYRRISGGGSVLHARGNLNYALFMSLTDFPQLSHIGESYRLILEAVASRLPGKVTVQGYSDLVLRSRGEWRKFSGNAQCRRRGWVMHHGTILYARSALRRIPWYLRPPPKQPEYRKNRPHRDFMTNVLPVYDRNRLMHLVRHGVAENFGAALRTVADPLAAARFAVNPPFQDESKRR